MPVCDGLDAAVAIRARLQQRCPPIVASTASTTEDEALPGCRHVCFPVQPIKAQNLGVLHELVASHRRKLQLGVEAGPDSPTSA